MQVGVVTQISRHGQLVKLMNDRDGRMSLECTIGGACSSVKLAFKVWLVGALRSQSRYEHEKSIRCAKHVYCTLTTSGLPCCRLHYSNQAMPVQMIPAYIYYGLGPLMQCVILLMM